VVRVTSTSHHAAPSSTRVSMTSRPGSHPVNGLRHTAGSPSTSYSTPRTSNRSDGSTSAPGGTYSVTPEVTAMRPAPICSPARRPPNPHDRLPVRKDHESTSYSGPAPVRSAPHEQYAAPNTSAQIGEWLSVQPGAVSTLNASCEPVRHSACSASISDGHRL